MKLESGQWQINILSKKILQTVEGKSSSQDTQLSGVLLKVGEQGRAPLRSAKRPSYGTPRARGLGKQLEPQALGLGQHGLSMTQIQSPG